jgi:hypothetical protein
MTLLTTLVLLCGAADSARGQAQSPPKRRDATQEKNIQLSPKILQAQPQTSLAQLKQQLLQARPEKFSPKVSNPNAVRARNSMIALLQQQQQAGTTERTLILSKHRYALVSTPTQGANPGARANGSVSAVSSAAHDAKSSTTILQPPSGAGHPQYSQLNPAACAQPEIYTVNGRNQGVVFTPDVQYHQYTIKGCKFGERQGEVHLYGHFKSPLIKMVVEFWSDDSIVATVDPGVSGELDQDNVTLVVKTTGAGQIQRGGFRFYAARETVLLGSIPAGDTPFYSGAPPTQWDVQYTSPVTDSSASTARVTRSSNYSVLPLRNIDTYDLRGLAPGFVGDSLQAAWSGMTQQQCAQAIVPGRLELTGNFIVAWNDKGFTVEYPVQQCNNYDSLYPPRQVDAANYWVTVWVTGPRGVSPR